MNKYKLQAKFQKQRSTGCALLTKLTKIHRLFAAGTNPRNIIRHNLSYSSYSHCFNPNISTFTLTYEADQQFPSAKPSRIWLRWIGPSGNPAACWWLSSSSIPWCKHDKCKFQYQTPCLQHFPKTFPKVHAWIISFRWFEHQVLAAKGIVVSSRASSDLSGSSAGYVEDAPPLASAYLWPARAHQQRFQFHQFHQEPWPQTGSVPNR